MLSIVSWFYLEVEVIKLIKSTHNKIVGIIIFNSQTYSKNINNLFQK